jgi:probable F420-dependent oxidoreductase
MKFSAGWSAHGFGTDPQELLAYARDVEECGFEGLYAPEHIAMNKGAKMGEWEVDPTIALMDPLDVLSFVAAGTTRLLLGTGVLLLPYHHPVVLAKRLATVDVLSGGRLRLLTVGVGAMPGEAVAAGVDFTTRGRRTDEALTVLRLLWSGGPEGVSHHGEFFGFDDLCSFPQPVGGPLPIHVGGSSAAAARRAGRLGTGYFAGGMLLPDERARQRDLARAAAAEAGHDPEALEFTRWGSIELTPEGAAKYADQGVTRMVVTPAGSSRAERRAELEAFAKRFALS